MPVVSYNVMTTIICQKCGKSAPHSATLAPSRWTTMCEGAPTEDHLGTAFALALPWAQKKGSKIADVLVICHI